MSIASRLTIASQTGTGTVTIDPAGEVRLRNDAPASGANAASIKVNPQPIVVGFIDYTWTIRLKLDALFTRLPIGNSGGKLFLYFHGDIFEIGNNGFIFNSIDISNVALPSGIYFDFKFHKHGMSGNGQAGQGELYIDDVLQGIFPSVGIDQSGQTPLELEIALYGVSAPTEVHIDNIKMESFGEYYGTTFANFNPRQLFSAHTFGAIVENISVRVSPLVNKSDNVGHTEVVTLAVV